MPKPSWTVVGLGTDLCEIERIAGVFQRQGDRFAEKVLGPEELALFHARRERSEARGIAFLATRFAAKEALSKALGTGMRLPMGWQACEVLPDAEGKPSLKLHGALAEHFEARRLRALVSLSDERGMASATVLMQQDESEDSHA
jgi:holo-[acyl-carrier protein] synthase